MSSREFAIEHPEEPHRQRRVVEFEVRLPRREELHLPTVDMEPVRAAAEQVLLTGIGVGVLVIRSLTQAIKAANQAGIEAAKEPGPIMGALLRAVRKQESAPSSTTEIRVKVPVLPIENYDELLATDILQHLPGLSPEELRVVREYEIDHKKRTTVLKAIDRRLATE